MNNKNILLLKILRDRPSIGDVRDKLEELTTESLNDFKEAVTNNLDVLTDKLDEINSELSNLTEKEKELFPYYLIVSDKLDKIPQELHCIVSENSDLVKEFKYNKNEHFLTKNEFDTLDSYHVTKDSINVIAVEIKEIKDLKNYLFDILSIADIVIKDKLVK